MRPISENNRQMILKELSEWAGVERVNLQNHRASTAEEIKKLAAGGLIEIGGHTVTHSPLSSLSRSDQQIEIVQSKTDLEKILGTEVTSFSYPYGLKTDFTPESIAIVREAGFERACTNVIDGVSLRSHLLELPRFWIRDWSGEEFPDVSEGGSMTESSNVKVVVILLTMNQKEKTIRCLKSFRSVISPPCKIVLWDNGSDDGTAEMVRQEFPDVLVHHHPQNAGVATGRNEATKIAMNSFNPAYLLFLYNDMT
jgi:peptidoglycan/xylan/chitin deacetylase (PgdA/CDA1 family)